MVPVRSYQQKGLTLEFYTSLSPYLISVSMKTGTLKTDNFESVISSGMVQDSKINSDQHQWLLSFKNQALEHLAMYKVKGTS